MNGVDANELYTKLGLQIRELREKANLNQDKFAQLLNLSRASIVNIEKGRQRPSIHLLFEISRLVDTKASNLVKIIENDLFPKSELDSNWKKVINKNTKGNSESKKKLMNFFIEIASKDKKND